MIWGVHQLPRGVGLVAAALLIAGVLPCAAFGNALTASVATTQIVQTEPVDSSYGPRAGLRVVLGGSAHCEAGSDSAGNTYRCFAGNLIYDPCWTDNGYGLAPAVVCERRPWETSITALTLENGGLEPFFGAAPSPAHMEPWGIQLATHERCTALQGAHDGFDGGKRIVDYACQKPNGRLDNRVLLRGINRSHRAWLITSATYEPSRGRYKLGPKLAISTAWYAIPDEADASAASASVCDVSALAYAARAYEVAHGEPEGPLPQIRRQACSGGYAIAVFIQEAPPPGYEASIAFGSTPSGWAVTGVSDYIEAGQFGIPEETYGQIMAALAGTADTEHVAF
jgi:hypothetical protein